MNCPLTVLMTVYNGAPYLRTAIDSILQQTYRDFRFLIIDDGSSDESREIVRSYDDERVELLCLERNVGQTAALNIGLGHASTPWIARMDQDDYSAPTRLEAEMRALETDQSLSCVGTYCWTFRVDPKRVEGLVEYPIEHEDLKRVLLRWPPMAHPSIVVSRAALIDVGGYNERYRYSADLEMYDRLLARYRAANIPRPLLGLRRHHSQVSSSRTAIEESIEIFLRRLSANTYGPEDAVLVRAGLSACYLQRARHLRAERKYSELLKDLTGSFWLSPKTFLRHGFSFLYVYLRKESAVRCKTNFQSPNG